MNTTSIKYSINEMKSIESLATAFFHAFYEKEWGETDDAFIENLSIEEAYAVQDLVAQKRVDLGESIAGFKVGCTSKAIHEQLGDSRITGGVGGHRSEYGTEDCHRKGGQCYRIF